jgi:membrane-associated phospholipid phosphatase
LAVALAATFAVAGAATYAVSFGSAAGRHADARVFDRISTRDAGELRQFGRRVGRRTLNTVAAAGVAVVAVVLAVLSLAGKTRLGGIATALLVGGAFATTELLKPPLGDWGRDLAPQRVATDAFPSGHATLAMAIVLAAAMSIPAQFRMWTNALGAAIATLLGLFIVIGGLHPPSDVVGGYFVAASWASLLTPFVRRPAGPRASATQRLGPSPGSGAAALLLLALAVAGVAFAESVFGLHRVFFVLVAALLIVSTLVVVAVGMLADHGLERASRRPTEASR